MIKVEKDFTNVPQILNSSNRRKAFNSNIKDKAFNHGKTLYKPHELKDRLHKIYNLKCVYCEDSLLNSPKHIEHYRPKDIYYWLAYSWDNLLLCCTSCNGSKGVNFKTINKKVDCDNVKFEYMHNLGKNYDDLEQPMLVNPEKEDVLKYLIFDREAQIFSKNDRVDYTIQNCNLNREELIELRKEILEDFILLINDYIVLFDKNNNLDKKTVVKIFIPVIRQFVNKCKKENKFYSFRYFILNNPDVFIENIPMQKIVKTLIKKLTV